MNHHDGNIMKFYFLSIFRGMAFFVPVAVLFWQENRLSMTEVMILQSLFSIAVVALENGYLRYSGIAISCLTC